MAKGKDAAQLTDPVPEVDNSTTIRSGSTFWDWLSEDHPRLRLLLIIAIIIAVIWWLFVFNTAYSVAAFCCIFLSVAAGFFMFRHELFFNDSVVLIAFGSDDITRCTVYVIGKEKFRLLNREGVTQVFTSDSGDPIYIADSFDGSTIHFPWSYETSRLRFVLEAGSFDELKTDAEAALREADRYRSLIKILGIHEGRDIVSRYEANLERLTHGQPPEASSEDVEQPEAGTLD